MNTLLVAIPVWPGDYETVLANLDKQFERDGLTKHCAFVFSDGRLTKDQHEKVRLKAKECFTQVFHCRYNNAKAGAPWPEPQNFTWQHIARCMEEMDIKPAKGWFMWESDALPLKEQWIDTLAEAYVKARKPFMGHVVPSRGHMNAVAVYPFNVSFYATKAMLVKASPFDVMLSSEVGSTNIAPANHLIAHRLKARGGDKAIPINMIVSRSFPDSTVIAHGYTDGVMTKTVPKGRSTFYHSGDLGDIIYSLPTIRELGGGELILGPDNQTNMATREKMTPERMAVIKPLLEAQPYIHSVEFSQTVPFGCTYDLNQMRKLMRAERLDLKPGFNIARCYLELVKLDLNNDSSPWLTVKENAVSKVVINRSSRYHNPKFRWDLIVRQYRKHSVFVGLPSEHADFESNFGSIEYAPTVDLLDLASVIAGCELFIGNQSAAYAIAEGLKKQAILEVNPPPNGSNTLFNRSSVIHEVTEDTILPSLESETKKRGRPKNSYITVVGPFDWFTGLGRATCQLVDGLVERDIKCAAVASTESKRIPRPKAVDDVLSAKIKPSENRILITPLLDLPSRIKTGDAVLTMWESTRLPKESVAAINKHASLLITPSRWCADVFSANGVNAPIKIVPFGVDPSVYTFQRKAQSIPIFGAAGRLAHGGTRKGIEDVIKAFQIAFPNKERALLKLKLFDDCYIPNFKDDRIKVEAETFTDEEMVEWYGSLSCFVSLSKGEGWGLHVHEALMCGIPVIAPAYSGLADLVPLHLKYEIVNASEGYSGHWCQPSIEHAAKLMNGDLCELGNSKQWLQALSGYVDGILEALK